MNREKVAANPLVEQTKFWLSIVVFFAGVVGYYVLVGESGWVRNGTLAAAILLGVLLFLFTQRGRDFIFYFRDSWRELRKVVWPSRKEALQTTLVVFVFVVILAIFIWGVDRFFEFLLYDLILGWRG